MVEPRELSRGCIFLTLVKNLDFSEAGAPSRVDFLDFNRNLDLSEAPRRAPEAHMPQTLIFLSVYHRKSMVEPRGLPRGVFSEL